MKIRPVEKEGRNRVYGLLRKGFPSTKKDLEIVQRLHRNEKLIYEWVCIHKNKNIAYIVFSNAYNGAEVCGLHLLFLFVKPEYQGNGIGTELLQFAMRQKEIKKNILYVLGDLEFFSKFGFSISSNVKSVLGGKRFKLLSTTQKRKEQRFVVGYEREVTHT